MDMRCRVLIKASRQCCACSRLYCGNGGRKKKYDVRSPSVSQLGVIDHSVLRGWAFRLNSSPALLLQLPFASLLSAPGIVTRDDCGPSADGACAYTIARRGRPSRGSASSTWSSSTTTPTMTLVLIPLEERPAAFVRARVNVRCSIPPTDRGKLCRPAMRCIWVTCSLSALSPVSSPKNDTSLNESAL